MVYIELKDKTNSKGVLVGNVLFNNTTVVACAEGSIPLRAKQLLKNGVLAKTTKAKFEAYEKAQEEANEVAKAVREKRRKSKEVQLASKGVLPKEKKEAAPKEAAPKKTAKDAK